jgi:hypothetical protein
MELVNELLNDPVSYRTAGTTMQTKITLELDNEILDAARRIADDTGENLSAVISRKLRAVIPISPNEELVDPRLGYKLLPVSPNARPVTLEEVNRLRDESE